VLQPGTRTVATVSNGYGGCPGKIRTRQSTGKLGRGGPTVLTSFSKR